MDSCVGAHIQNQKQSERCGKPNEFLPQLQLLTETKNRKGPCTYVGAA